MPKKYTKKTPKNPQSNTDDGFLSKNYSWHELIAGDALLQYPGRDEWRKRLIATMLQESASGDLVEVGEFMAKYRFNHKNFLNWCDAYPDLREAYELMKSYIATHRKAGCIRKKYDFQATYFEMHKLDPSIQETYKLHDDRKKEIAETQNIILRAAILSEREDGKLPKPEVLPRETNESN